MGKTKTLNNKCFSLFFTLEDKFNIPSVENLGSKEQEPLEITENMFMKVITKFKRDKFPGPEC